MTHNFNWNYQRRLHEKLLAQMPNAWNLCYPRRIIPPHGYANPSHLSFHLMANLVMAADHRMNQSPHFAAVTTTMRLLEYNVPIYFLAEDWLQAVLRTDPPMDWIIQETIMWPMNAMSFVLPESMSRFLGFYCPFMSVCRSLSTDQLPSADLVKRMVRGGVEVLPRPIDVVPRDRMAMFFPVYHSETDDPITYTGNFLLESQLGNVLVNEMVDAMPYEYEVMGLKVSGKEHYPKGAPMGDEEIKLNQYLNHTLMKILLALSVYPDVIEMGAIQRPAKVKHGRTKEALWNPNIIGRNYRIKREAPGTGTHASPVMHWRRGHYRKQRYGHGNSQVRIILIEPMLINAKQPE